MNSELLLKIQRSNLVEREHYGFVTIVDTNGIISSIGNPETQFFLRSCAKPFQALPIVTSGAFKRFNFTHEELAVCCASHTASEYHLKHINSILLKTGLTHDNLKCGIHDPIDPESRKHLIKNDLNAGHIHNNCSGKHSGMLSVCLHKGYSLKDYLDFDHPLQLEIREIIKRYCQVDKMETSLDGCSLPVYGMPLYKMAIGFLNFFADKKNINFKKAFTENPILIGGKGRIDSELMKATDEKLVAKLGAEGLCIVVNQEKEQALIVKILDSSIQARAIVTIEALKQLEWIDEKALSTEGIQKLYDLKISTLNKNNIGKIKPVFKI